MFFALFNTWFPHSEHKSLCLIPVISEQVLTILLREFQSLIDEKPDQQEDVSDFLKINTKNCIQFFINMERVQPR